MIRAALALWAITYSAALAPAITGPDKPDLWHNVIESKAGHVYILDYDLTLVDCYDRMMENPGSACERQ